MFVFSQVRFKLTFPIHSVGLACPVHTGPHGRSPQCHSVERSRGTAKLSRDAPAPGLPLGVVAGRTLVVAAGDVIPAGVLATGVLPACVVATVVEAAGVVATGVEAVVGAAVVAGLGVV